MDDEKTFDKIKTKVLKYVLYKKRSEAEIRQKFTQEDEEMLDEIIRFLKENEYINDESYIEKAVNEYQRLKNMSIKEIKYKLLSKGINKEDIENYIYNHQEELQEYELNSAKNIFIKKQATMDAESIISYLRKKGYKNETIQMLKGEQILWMKY